MVGWKRWLATAVLIFAAAVAVAAAVIGQIPFPRWAEALVAGVAVIAGVFISPLQSRLTSWLNGPDIQRAALLACTRLHAGKRLPKVRDSGNPLLLGVHPAGPPAAMPPYVARDADSNGTLAQSFERGGLIVVTGPSASGKTRFAYEAMRQHAPGRTLIVPSSLDKSLPGLREAGVPLENAVVWLDNIDGYLAEGGLDAAVLDYLRPAERADILILATLRTEARKDLVSRSDLKTSISRAVEEVLDRASFIVLDGALTAAERERAGRERADSRIAAALDQNGGAQFAAYIAAAPDLLMRWQTCLGTAGGILVTAAVDARRAGLHAPLTRALLAELYALYPGAGQDFDEAMAWTIEPVRGASGCLIPLPDDTFQPFDYLLDHAQRAAMTPPVPTLAWPVLLRHADTADLTSLADAAYGAGQTDISEDALKRAAAAGLDSAIDDLAVLMAALASATDKMAKAKALISAHANALYAYGVMDEEADRTEKAKTFYQMAADLGHADAARRLSELLAADGREAEARHWRDRP